MSNFQQKSDFIWDLADLLRGPYKRNEYQKVILPFTVLKRFDSVLEHSKKEVLDTYDKYKNEFDNLDHILLDVARDKDGNRLEFYNYSKYNFKSLLEDPENIEDNLKYYIDSFSKNAQQIFENFQIKTHIEKLSKVNRLYILIKKFSESKVDLHPDKVSNHEMGTIFEDLIRRFAEQSNEEAGEHFTPRDVVKLMTHLIFIENGIHLKEKNLIRKIYDPACGTGGMLTSCKEFVKDINNSVDIVLYGQEINEEIYAICKADMLIKGEESKNIKGPSSTLSDDRFPNDKFDFMISNPPYGTKWEADEDDVKKEAEKGFSGRFGAGLPKKNDGQLLFLQHMISKMKEDEKSRIAVITNGSPLFAADPAKKPNESQIRRWMIENDLIEAIIALPDQLFYNTGIKTYIWILTNCKPAERIGKIQLIDASNKFKKMHKSLGNKRNRINEENKNSILKLYTNFENNNESKILDNTDLGYTKVIVERPMQLNYQITEDRLENIYTIPSFSKLAKSDNENPAFKLAEEDAGKEKQKKIIKELRKADNRLYKDWDEFAQKVKEVLKSFELTNALIRNIIIALSEHDDTADYVKDIKGNLKPDQKLRDSEKVPLNRDIDEYFEKEVLPYYPDAWMDRKSDKVGYEINFAQYFYKYEPPRPLEEIEKDIKEITSEIQELLREDVDGT
ncbi:type I restriction-modification system subunit M [Methanobacterium sp. ACI-7]|uniref:type I restriction-modification system subunit M n=1 Tax=unclassified Methanobacterium TaxID=2627676 RepID=UPI0039C2F1BD